MAMFILAVICQDGNVNTCSYLSRWKCLLLQLFVTMAMFILAVICHDGNVKHQNLNGISFLNLNVFSKLVMRCNGKLTAWEFYSLNQGTVFLSLWKYEPEKNTATLMGKNRIRVFKRHVGKSSVSLAVKAF